MLYDYETMIFGDELLGPNVEPKDLAKAESWLYAFAKRLRVAQDDVIRSFVVDELVTLYAYREVATNKAASMNGAYSRGGESGDYYADKMKYINARISVLEQQITPEQLTGKPSTYSGYRSIPIFRG